MRLPAIGTFLVSLGPAAFLLPLAGVIALIAAVSGNWLVVAAMVLVIIGQVLLLQGMRRRRNPSAGASAQPRGVARLGPEGASGAEGD